MKTNPSQYSGTLKNSICTICNKKLNHLNKDQQDKHAEDHKKQQKESRKQETLF